MRSTLALYLAKADDKEAALRELSQLELSKSENATVFFRMAVAYEVCALRGRALTMLEKSLKAGYAQREVRNDPELLKLRNDIRYHKLLSALPSTQSP